MHQLSTREFMTVRETAELLNVGVSHVYNLIARKELPAKKFGGVVRIALAAIESYILRSDAAPSAHVEANGSCEVDRGA